MTLSAELQKVDRSFGFSANIDSELERILKQLEDERTAPGLYIGDRVPDFTLPNAVAKPVTLYERLAKGPVVLSFNRGVWCPYCNAELRAFQEIVPQITASGATLMSVTSQRPDESLSFTEKLTLQFDLLSDVDQKVIRDYKLWYAFPDDLRNFYANIYGLDVSELNANSEWTLPVPGTFILDQDGIIRARHVAMDYRKRMEPSDILAVLKTLVPVA
jgi:peroxiredoxin